MTFVKHDQFWTKMFSVCPDTGCVLEVTDLPAGISRVEADSILAELSKVGALIKWLPKPSSPSQSEGADVRNSDPPKPPLHDLASTYTILALFPSKYMAQNALQKLSCSITKFKLRTSKEHNEQHTLARSSSQWGHAPSSLSTNHHHCLRLTSCHFSRTFQGFLFVCLFLHHYGLNKTGLLLSNGVFTLVCLKNYNVVV